MDFVFYWILCILLCANTSSYSTVHCIEMCVYDSISVENANRRWEKNGNWIFSLGEKLNDTVDVVLINIYGDSMLSAIINNV